ncbi:hypothetical protein P1J78_05935 [Psychromarinibacter sp. C21-152]|uniref:Ig-like domain-containing protein n=1 Tax=Psychromarinibacter sediminicola TaxID=3033385 RepID=A0AAE3T809_9RHOB|nr:hypothetical protein [Psychromarinibacter sediminicola]MDF0600263.1 hypothetical protein [Psychromarinibacter sediminicola]
MPRRALLALALVALAPPAQAAQTTPGVSPHQTAPIRPGPAIELTAASQTCPAGFDVATATAFTYQCRMFAPGNTAPGHAFVAGQKPCDNRRYWTDGPNVTITPSRGGGVVVWTCRHL